MNFQKVFHKRTVFITGADGFIGSHLVEKLVEWGADIRAFVRASSSGLKNIKPLKNKIKIYFGNLEDKHSVDEAIKDLKNGQEIIVFHLAAQAHVGDSWRRPFDTINSNIIGTLYLLQSIVDNNIKLFKFNMAGTSEEYGNLNGEMKQHYDFLSDKNVVLHERSPVNPKSIYGTSKLAADFLTRNYCDAYGLPTVITRLFNNYGPRQNPRYITGTIITQALIKDYIELGNVKVKRDFCYVSDGVMGHINVALFGTPGDIYVCGKGENISIMDWLNLILKVGIKMGVWGKKKLIVKQKRFRPGKSEVNEYLVNYKKLNELTGWKPQISWEEGLSKTIKWYSENNKAWHGRIDWQFYSELDG
ncbi:MAG: GDP-mannose 4,6-dehydratase [bacterium]